MSPLWCSISDIATAATTYKKGTGVTEHTIMDFYMTLPSNGGGTEFNHVNNNTPVQGTSTQSSRLERTGLGSGLGVPVVSHSRSSQTPHSV